MGGGGGPLAPRCSRLADGHLGRTASLLHSSLGQVGRDEMGDGKMADFFWWLHHNITAGLPHGTRYIVYMDQKRGLICQRYQADDS